MLRFLRTRMPSSRSLIVIPAMGSADDAPDRRRTPRPATRGPSQPAKTRTRATPARSKGITARSRAHAARSRRATSRAYILIITRATGSRSVRNAWHPPSFVRRGMCRQ